MKKVYKIDIANVESINKTPWKTKNMNKSIADKNYENWKENFQVLTSCYRLSKYEIARLPKFTFRQQPAAGEPPLKRAALEIYTDALILEKNYKQGSDECNLLWKARSEAYEICDHFGSATGDMVDEFTKFVELPDNDLKALVDEAYRDNFKISEDYFKAFYLAFTSGINALYKRHNEDGYRRAEEAVRRFKKLPQILVNPNLDILIHVPRGNRALAKYLEGKVLSAQGKKGDDAFLQSLELYAETLKELDKDESLSNGDAAEKKSVIIRRMTIVSAFGIGYSFLVNSELKNATQILSPARAITKHFAGEVYAAYTEYLYRRTKRAKNSFDKDVLTDSLESLEMCLEVFNKYVPTSDYIPRTEIELALCEYYLAKIAASEQDTDKMKKFGKQARSRLERLAFNDETRENFNNYSDSVLSETLTMLSYIILYNDSDLELSEEIADRALKISRGTQYYYEALLAKGTCHYRKAQLSGEAPAVSGKEGIENPSGFSQEDYEGAYDRFSETLRENVQNNPRITAIANLKLVELNLLRPETFPLARFHFQQWEKIEDKVEHEFIRERAATVRDAFKRYDKAYFFVSLDEHINLETWHKRVTEFLVNQVLSDLATKYNEGIIDNDQYKTQITHALQDKLEINRSTAYKWLEDEKERNLVAKLKRLIKTR